MKKIVLLFLLAVCFSMVTSVQSNAQCTSNTAAYWTHTASNTLNVADALSTCHYLTEYSTINGMLVGGLYQFTITSGGGTGNGYITVMTGPGGTGTVVGHGVSPLTVVATGATMYPHWNVNASCGTSTFCEVGTMTYLAPPSSCIQPVSLGASAITTTSALLNWTDANTTPAPNYDVYYALAFSPPPSSTTPATATSTSDTLTISGLTPSTQYDYYVRGRCTATDTSAWSGPYTFTTLATCLVPTGLTATAITPTSATLGWTENNAATQWDIELGLTGFTPLGTPVIPNLGTNPFTLPGLPSNTCFDFYVRSQCSVGDTSSWAGPFTFCTSIAPLVCPPGSSPSIIYSEEFTNTFTGQTNIPNAAAAGWTNTATANPRWALESNGTGSASTGPNFGAQGSQGYAYLEVSCVSGGSDTLISPSIDLSGIVGAAEVKFFNHMYGPNSGKMELFIDNGTTLTSVWVDSGQTQASSTAAWDSAVVSLSPFVGQSINLKFVGTAANPGGCSGDRGLDQISITGCVSCSAPSALAASNITASTADISWTQAGTPSAWHLEVLPTGNTPTGTPTDTATTNPYTLTGLTLYQAVDVYIRADCGANGLSSWVGPISILPCAPLAGTYTVDPALPASATNFQTMASVAFALQCGISAPVIFDMAPGNTFTEQVEFPEVTGASATNTVTFNGNGDSVVFATNSTNYAVIRLDGSDHFRFNDLNVVSTGTAQAISMHVFIGNNSANHNIFTNCTFAVPITATSSAVNAIGFSGSLTSANATPTNRADSNIIDSCTVIGGYFGMPMWGQTTAPYSSGNQILNTKFEDYYIYGLYHAYQDNMVVSNCDFSRPTRTSLSTCYGLYGTGLGSSNLYEKNHIHDIFGSNPASTSTFYGFYFFMDASSAATSNRVENNLIEDIEGNGTHYDMYFSTANNIKVYHNTVIEDNAAATGGTTRGIYQAGTGAVGQDIQNNNIYITKGGTGTNHGIWLDAAAPTCDYNNVYVAGAGTNWFGENGGNQSDLTAWQASTPTVGANSLGVDPLFVNPAPDYTPNNPAMNDQGNPALGVTEDFLNATRSVTPDMGAFEFSVAPTDIATTAILAPDTSIGCYTAADSVVVEITNYGSTTHDFSLNPTTVTAQVTGTVTATLTAVVNTDTLPPLGTLSVTLAPTVNMTANGAYAINAYSNTVGDPTLTNDTLVTTYNYNVNLVTGTIEASPNILCVSGTSDVTMTGMAGGLIQWQTSATGAAPWTNVGAGMNPHTSATLTSTTFYRALLTCNAASDSTNIDTIVVNNPLITSTTTDTVCGTGVVTLGATSSSATINWYDAATGGTLLDTGSSFSTTISAIDTFYCAPLDGAGKVLITEVCNFNGAAGWATPTAPVPSGVQDPIEFTNIGTAPVDMSGWKVEVTGGSAGSWTFPAGAIVPPNSTVVLGRGATPGGTFAGQYYQATTLPTSSSGTALGVILSDGSSAIQDVVSYNNYAVVGTGTPMATAADWSGTVPSGSGTSGIRRTVTDDSNDGADWTVASASNLTNYGAVNVAFTPAGCEGNRTAVIAHSLSAPAIAASNDSTVCWDSTVTVPLTVSSANTNYTYSWAPAYGLNMTTGATVNASPLTPTQYVVTANDATTGCANTDTINIDVQTQFWDTASADISYLCGAGTVNLAAGDSIPPIAGYCASGATNGFDTKIDTVSFAGVTTGTALTAQETYTDNTAIVIPAAAGVALPLSVRNGSSSNFYYGGTLTVYIDYDQNGVFDPSELVYTFATTGINTIPPTTITIPTTALNGSTRMRFVLPESNPSVPCGTWVYGETEDYTVNISGATTPVGNTYTYTWTPGPLTGPTQAVTPTAPTTYVVTQTDQFGCTAQDSVSVFAGPVSGDLAQATPSNTASVAGTVNQTAMQADGTTLDYTDVTCNLISTVVDAPGGNILGMVSSTVTVDATVPTHNGEPFTARWYQISPASNGPADVTLYFTQADFDSYNAHPAVVGSVHDSLPTGPLDVAGIARLRITKNDNGGLGVNPVEITPTSVTWVAADSRWEVTFPVTSFSQFRAHALNPLNAPLPVSLTKFTVTKEGSVSFAAWITESEQNNSHFNLQRSLDGNAFTTLGKVNSKAVNGYSSTELNYNFTDNAPQIGHNYYRLEQVDQDGNLSYSRIIDVVWGADGSVVSIYPNPATDKLNVDVSIDKVAQLEVRLLDMSGRVVKSVMQQTQKGMNNVTLDLSDIASGVYGVQIYENNSLIHTGKVNKQTK